VVPARARTFRATGNGGEPRRGACCVAAHRGVGMMQFDSDPNSMTRWCIALALTAALGCGTRAPVSGSPSNYLFVWAGPQDHESLGARADHAANTDDFLAVVDADPASNTYGRVVASKDVGIPGEMAHHIELSLPAGHALFASDFMTGRVFLLDVSNPRAPRVIARIDSVPGYRRPHSFARIANGHVLATLQFGNGSVPGDPGGVAEFDAEGKLVRTSSAADARFAGAHIRPNGIELLPAIDRVVTTSMPMDDERTADVLQVWRLSDLRLLQTIALPVAAGDTVTHMPYDSRALSDGRSVMVNTYSVSSIGCSTSTPGTRASSPFTPRVRCTVKGVPSPRSSDTIWLFPRLQRTR